MAVRCILRVILRVAVISTHPGVIRWDRPSPHISYVNVHTPPTEPFFCLGLQPNGASLIVDCASEADFSIEKRSLACVWTLAGHRNRPSHPRRCPFPPGDYLPLRSSYQSEGENTLSRNTPQANDGSGAAYYTKTLSVNAEIAAIHPALHEALQTRCGLGLPDVAMQSWYTYRFSYGYRRQYTFTKIDAKVLSQLQAQYHRNDALSSREIFNKARSASPRHEPQACTSPLSEPEAGTPVVEGRVRLATDSKARVGGVLRAEEQ